MFTCDICGAQFKYEDRLKMHKSFKHPVPSVHTPAVVSQPSPLSMSDFIKECIKRGDDDRSLFVNTVVTFPKETGETINDMIMLVKEDMKPKPVVQQGSVLQNTVQESPKHAPKLYRILRRTDEKKIRIELGGEEYYEYVLTNLPSNLLKELGEEVVNTIYNFLKEHEGENFQIVKMGEE